MAVAKSLPLLYMTELSPPVRSVLMTARALGVQLQTKEMNLGTGEHRTENFIKKNPQGTVPTLEDNDYALWDSHAISGYLVNKYGKDDNLYPKDPQRRALVDQRLHFDTGILYPEFRGVVVYSMKIFMFPKPVTNQRGELYKSYMSYFHVQYPIIFEKEKKISRGKIERVEASYKILDSLLANHKKKWLAGDNMTIADLCSVSTISTLEVLVPTINKFAHLDNWMKTCKKEIPGYQETNQQGLDKLVKLIKARLARDV